MANPNNPQDPNRKPGQREGQTHQGGQPTQGTRTGERGRTGRDADLDLDRDTGEDLGDRQADGNLGNERTRTKDK